MEQQANDIGGELKTLWPTMKDMFIDLQFFEYRSTAYSYFIERLKDEEIGALVKMVAECVEEVTKTVKDTAMKMVARYMQRSGYYYPRIINYPKVGGDKLLEVIGLDEEQQVKVERWKIKWSYVPIGDMAMCQEMMDNENDVKVITATMFCVFYSVYTAMADIIDCVFATMTNEKCSTCDKRERSAAR
jgi:hypothetical protein